MHKYDNDLRQKMESMDAVPSTFKFDAASTWQKMENQLQPSTNKKRMAWVYWAAACIVLIITGFCMLVTINKQANHFVETPTTKQQEKLVVNNVTASKKIFNSSIQNQVQKAATKNETIIKTIVEAKQQTFLISDSSIQQEEVAMVQVTKNIDEVTPIIANTNVTVSIKPIAQKKQRLKVVHINELDAPLPPIIAKLDSKKQLQEQSLNEATDNEPIKPFWLKKAKQPNLPSSSFTDNQ